MDLITYPDGQRITYVINAGNLLWMPTDTPFGNLTPKLFWVMTLLAHANHRLEQSAAHWSAAMSGSIGHDPVEHKLTAGEAVFSMRRAADELVSLTAVLDERLETGSYPTKPKYDSVGSAFDKGGNPKAELWAAHAWLLQTLNDLANAHKHSFVDSDTTELPRAFRTADPLGSFPERKSVRVIEIQEIHSGVSRGGGQDGRQLLTGDRRRRA